MALEDPSKPREIVSGAPPADVDFPPPPDGAPAHEVADRRILEQARAGSQDAFRQLVESHQDRVFRLMRRLLRCDRDTAADFAQEVFLRVHRGLAAFDGRAKFTTWLYKIAVNVSISEYRHRGAQKRGRWTFSLDAPMPGTDDLHAEPVAADPDPAARAYHQEIAGAVRAAMDELPEEFRQAVVLRDLQGLAYEEIGELLGVPAGTVRSRIHRGRLMLQDKLRDYRP